MLKIDRRELLIFGSSTSALMMLGGCAGVAEGVVATVQDGFSNRSLGQIFYMMGCYVDTANKCVKQGLTFTQEAYGAKSAQTNAVANRLIESGSAQVGYNVTNGVVGGHKDGEANAKLAGVTRDMMAKGAVGVQKINSSPAIKNKLGASLVMFKSANFFQTRAVGGLVLLGRKMAVGDWKSEVDALLRNRQFALTLEALTAFPDNIRTWQKTFDTVEEIPKKVEETLDDGPFVSKMSGHVSTFANGQAGKISKEADAIGPTNGKAASGPGGFSLPGGMGMPK
jgi:hypothetical protein